MVIVSLDSNVLFEIVGMYFSYNKYACGPSDKRVDNAKEYVDDNHREGKIDDSVRKLYKGIEKGDIRVVLLPTVVKEYFNTEKSVSAQQMMSDTRFRSIVKALNFSVVNFNKEEQQQVDDLVNLFLSKQRGSIFKVKKNSKFRYNDAIIMAESIVARTSLITHDKHFSNVEEIQQRAYGYYQDAMATKSEKSRLRRVRPFSPQQYMSLYENKSFNKLMFLRREEYEFENGYKRTVKNKQRPPIYRLKDRMKSYNDQDEYEQ